MDNSKQNQAQNQTQEQTQEPLAEWGKYDTVETIGNIMDDYYERADTHEEHMIQDQDQDQDQDEDQNEDQDPNEILDQVMEQLKHKAQHVQNAEKVQVPCVQEDDWDEFDDESIESPQVPETTDFFEDKNKRLELVTKNLTAKLKFRDEEIESLKSEVSIRDEEIDSLRARLRAKEERIHKLIQEEPIRKQPMQGQTMPCNYKSYRKPKAQQNEPQPIWRSYGQVPQTPKRETEQSAPSKPTQRPFFTSNDYQRQAQAKPQAKTQAQPAQFNFSNLFGGMPQAQTTVGKDKNGMTLNDLIKQFVPNTTSTTSVPKSSYCSGCPGCASIPQSRSSRSSKSSRSSRPSTKQSGTSSMSNLDQNELVDLFTSFFVNGSNKR